VLDFRRFESGHRALELRALDVVALARTVADDFTHVEPNRVEVRTMARRLPVEADPEALALALRNLVDNALKYSSPPAPVTIAVEAACREVRIGVHDCGPGLTCAERREVFQRFVRGSAARTSNVKGTGLGLALVERVVQAHGGRVDVESTLGVGSVFTIVLPVQAAETGKA
jgi:two-component system sensor histidine kinase SenX3